jgi:hypothetical protein
MKFRKKPVVIEAEQFLSETADATGFIATPAGVYWDLDGKAPRAYVVTIHQQRVYLEDGDWIVPEPDGKHYYPIKDLVMRLNYGRVRDGTDTGRHDPGCAVPAGPAKERVKDAEVISMRESLLDEILELRGIG